MSSFSPSQVAELQQMIVAAGSGRGTRIGVGSNFSQAQLAELRQLILSVTTDASKGRYAGFGNPQVDTYNYPDNCTASFPWTFDFVIPKNFQRWTSVHLSFKLRAFRRYVASVNTATSSTTPHYHTWVLGGQTNAPAPTYDIGTNGGGGPINGPSTGIPSAPFGFQTATETAVGGAQFSSFTAFDSNGTGHSHTLTPTLVTGIFEDTMPTSVSIKIDSTDYTSTLGGPWTTDTVELDITKVMPNKIGVFHTIQLTPNQNGRITGELRFSYFVDASVSA